jgi:hypothetical protein
MTGSRSEHKLKTGALDDSASGDHLVLIRPEWLFEVAHAAQTGTLSNTLSAFPELAPPRSVAELHVYTRLRAVSDLMWADLYRRCPSLRYSSNGPYSADPASRSHLTHKLETARRVLEHDHGHHWTLTSLSRHTNSNRCDLEKGFRVSFGLTVHDWLTLCRTSRLLKK